MFTVLMICTGCSLSTLNKDDDGDGDGDGDGDDDEITDVVSLL